MTYVYSQEAINRQIAVADKSRARWKAMTPKQREQRVEDLVQGRAAGETLQALADAHGISRERVRQILAKAERVAMRIKREAAHCV